MDKFLTPRAASAGGDRDAPSIGRRRGDQTARRDLAGRSRNRRRHHRSGQLSRPGQSRPRRVLHPRDDVSAALAADEQMYLRHGKGAPARGRVPAVHRVHPHLDRRIGPGITGSRSGQQSQRMPDGHGLVGRVQFAVQPPGVGFDGVFGHNQRGRDVGLTWVGCVRYCYGLTPAGSATVRGCGAIAGGQPPSLGGQPTSTHGRGRGGDLAWWGQILGWARSR